MKKLLIGIALGGLALAPLGANAQGPEFASKIELKPLMTAISCQDIEAMTAFYVDALDFEVVKDAPLGAAMHFRWLRNGGQGIELVQVANSQPGPVRGAPPAHLGVRGFSHLMVQVDDLEATKAALLAKGVTPSVDIIEIASLGIKVLFVTDPEGNAIEVAQVTAG